MKNLIPIFALFVCGCTNAESRHNVAQKIYFHDRVVSVQQDVDALLQRSGSRLKQRFKDDERRIKQELDGIPSLYRTLMDILNRARSHSGVATHSKTHCQHRDSSPDMFKKEAANVRQMFITTFSKDAYQIVANRDLFCNTEIGLSAIGTPPKTPRCARFADTHDRDIGETEKFITEHPINDETVLKLARNYCAKDAPWEKYIGSNVQQLGAIIDGLNELTMALELMAPHYDAEYENRCRMLPTETEIVEMQQKEEKRKAEAPKPLEQKSALPVVCKDEDVEEVSESCRAFYMSDVILLDDELSRIRFNNLG